jgi:hypothetical protein
MMGSAHISFLQYCVRSKIARDLKASGVHAERALHRLRIARDCERILGMLARHRDPEPHEVASMLGWRPPLVLLDAGLNAEAQAWLDSRYATDSRA